MKVKMVFTLPDEEYEWRCAANGHRYRYLLGELGATMRSHIKYENKLTIEQLYAQLNEGLSGIEGEEG